MHVLEMSQAIYLSMNRLKIKVLLLRPRYGTIVAVKMDSFPNGSSAINDVGYLCENDHAQQVHSI